MSENALYQRIDELEKKNEKLARIVASFMGKGPAFSEIEVVEGFRLHGCPKLTLPACTPACEYPYPACAPVKVITLSGIVA